MKSLTFMSFFVTASQREASVGHRICKANFEGTQPAQEVQNQ